MIIFTHRGLEPSKPGFFPESSFEAFEHHIQRGFGIEFDPNVAKDGVVVSHDATLARITEGADTRAFGEVGIAELQTLRYGAGQKGRIPLFSEVLQMIETSKAAVHAFHLKGGQQTQESIDAFLTVLKAYPSALSKIVVFDIKPEWARYIRSKLAALQLAPSVSHLHDIARYNEAVKGTLYSVDEALAHKDLYDWAWLDEWDTADADGGKKQLLTQDVFETLRNAGYKIALVTPELHASSPGLLGGEAHEDAATQERLFARIKEIVALKPDAVCTDYPEEVLNMIRGGE